jgi:hypothetical protein
MRRETLPPLFAIAWQPMNGCHPLFLVNIGCFDGNVTARYDPRNARKFSTVADAVSWLEEHPIDPLWNPHVVGLLPERDGWVAQKGEHAEPPAGETEATEDSAEDRAMDALIVMALRSYRDPTDQELDAIMGEDLDEINPETLPELSAEDRAALESLGPDFIRRITKGERPLQAVQNQILRAAEPTPVPLGNLPILAPPIQRVSKTSPEGARFGLGQYGYTKYGASVGNTPAGPRGSCGPGGCCPR